MTAPHKLSVDQCLTISEHLYARSQTVRGEFFKQLSETAALEDWPSSCESPFHLLTEDECASIWIADADIRQRVFAPFLTITELESLRHDINESAEYFRRNLGTRS